MRLNIAFDIDGCFVDLIAQVRVRLKLYGIEIIDNGSYEIETNPKLTVSQLWEHFIECYSDWRSVPIYPGAEDICNMLWGYPIHFITTRPSKSATFTCATIERFCKGPYTVSFSDNFSKLRFLNGYKAFVEDRRSTAKEIAATGRTVYVPRRPWNDMPDQPGIVKIDGIHNLIANIDEFIMEEKNGS